MTAPVVWCGADPGIANFGVAFLLREEKRWRALHVETVRTEAKERMHERLLKLHAAIVHRPVTGYGKYRIRYAVEQQEQARLGAEATGETNHYATRVERVIGMLWEHALMAPYAEDSELIEVTPRRMRQSLGLPATATKRQIEELVKRIVIGLPKTMSAHAYDACAIAIAGERTASLDARLVRTS